MTGVSEELMFKELNRENYDNAFVLHQHSHNNPWSESAFIDCLNKPYFSWQVTLCEKVVGYFIGLNVVGEVTLMDIGICGKHQGLGIGRKTLEHFFEQSRRLNAFEVWLEVRQSNLRAIRLYESSQFDLIERRKNYYSVSPSSDGEPETKEDALVMKKTL